MRRLTDVTITSADRPAPPREKSSRRVRVESVTAPKPRARRAAPGWLRRVMPGWMRRTLLGTAAVAAFGIFAGGALWFLHSNFVARTESAAAARLVDLSLKAGLAVAHVDIEGEHRVASKDLLAALQVKEGDPILGIDLSAARARIAAIPGVQSVTIERRLPDAVQVFVAEREPVAIWQNDGRYQLVDRAGMPAGDNVGDFPGLPLVVGPDAPAHVATLLDMLAAEPALRPRVKASQWVSTRRWTVQMSGPVGDIEVRLPEADPAAAWRELAQLEADQKLLDRKVVVVDMRLPGRLVLRIPGGTEQPAKAGPTSSSPARRKPADRDA